MNACIYNKDVSSEDALLKTACEFSPLIEKAAPDTVVFDIGGLGGLIGDEYEIAQAIARETAQALPDQEANICIAANPPTAICAALFINGVTIIPAGREVEFNGDLPVDALSSESLASRVRLSEKETGLRFEVVETLKRWGIRRFREFADLAETRICERLGPAGLLLHRLARGKLDRPLQLARPQAIFEETMEPDDPIELAAPLSFIIKRLADSLIARLDRYALAAQEFNLCLGLEDKSEANISIRLPFPTLDAGLLIKLMMIEIESRPPRSPVIGIRMGIEPAKPRYTEQGLFEPAPPQPEKLELTVARIAKLIGTANAGSPSLLDTHRPDAFAINRIEMSFSRPRSLRPARAKQAAGVQTAALGAPARIDAGIPDRGQMTFTDPGLSNATGAMDAMGEDENKIYKAPLGFRRFRPPLPARVLEKAGSPVSIDARESKGAAGIKGRIVKTGGPWRASGDWWVEDAWLRDEWDIALADGAVYRVYRNQITGRWFVEGMYD